MDKNKLIDVSNPSAAGLTQLLAEQSISLRDNELARVAELLGRDPSLVELHIFNIMWSEHCSYKSSRDVLKTLPTTGPHVVLGPGEDAGIIRFHEKDGRSYCLVLAHESHNHPSQVLPAEGAATGIGGIVRDVYCMGADVIGVLDPLRFGDPDGGNARRVRDIVRGVVDGIGSYGNALGVPNWGGETYFDSSFDDNCLVNVVAIGSVPEDEVIRSRAPQAALDTEHDIILIGKPTDASGFGGAAFASARLSGDEAEERQEAVQVADPFLKRVVAEATKAVLRVAHDEGVAIGFKDLGAGGIACAVSEVCQAAGVGGTIDLDAVNRAADLPAQVIACSETQERFAMVVPKAFSPRVCRIYNEDFDLPHVYSGAGAYVIGVTNTDKLFTLKAGGEVVCDADVDAITTGIKYQRDSKAPLAASYSAAPTGVPSPEEALMTLLGTYNLCDKSILFRHYDSEVQGRAVLRPGEADAAVAVFMPGEVVGVAAGIGSHSRVGEVDPYLGGAWSVIEAARNVAAVGAQPLAMTDCLNFGDPEDPHVFWQFTEAVRGIADACNGLKVFDDPDQGVPIVSGNVSFYNQSGQGRPIAPTPIVACAGRVDDVSVSRNLGFKQAGSHVLLLGELHERLGGSEYARHFLPSANLEPPRPDFAAESAIIRALIRGFDQRAILAAHDISLGGIAVTLAEMVTHSAPFNVGCRITIEAPTTALFAEYSGVVVEVDAAKYDAFTDVLREGNVMWQQIGTTDSAGHLQIETGDGARIAVSLDDIDTAQRKNGKCNPLFA